MNVHAQNVSHKYNNKQRNHRNMNISLSNAKLQQVLEICKVKAIDLTRAKASVGKSMLIKSSSNIGFVLK